MIDNYSIVMSEVIDSRIENSTLLDVKASCTFEFQFEVNLKNGIEIRLYHACLVFLLSEYTLALNRTNKQMNELIN